MNIGTQQISKKCFTVAAFLLRAFITAADAGLGVLCWFSSQDRVEGSDWTEEKRREAEEELRRVPDDD